MIKDFDKDPMGAILEYAYLTSSENNSKQKERNAWEKRNIKTKSSHFWNGYMEAPVLSNLLASKGKKEEVRTKISRIFRKIENNDLVEPNPEDDNPNTRHRIITPLGKELLLEDSYLEYINGAQYIADKWKHSIVKIYHPKDNGIGTGFLIDTNLVVTAKHVVENLDEFVIEFESGLKYQYEDILLPKKIQDLDIAVIKLKDDINDIVPFKLSTNYDILEEVVIFGYPPVPQSDNSYLVTNRGEVSSIIQLYSNQIQVLIISSILRGGNSGGPIVNRRGKVIGVVSENLYNDLAPGERNINEGLAFAAAIGSEWIKDLINGKV